jgi:hypothetical protein
VVAAMSPTVPTSPTVPIPSVSAFVNALKAALGTGIGHALSAASNGADVYEAYLMAIVLNAATDIGMSIALEDTSGATQTTLTLRTAPSSITSGSFTHAVLSGPSGAEVLEVHTGVYVKGTSGAFHECDVVILKREAGVRCRKPPHSDPHSSAVVWAMEAKFYVAENVGIAKAREYFGLNLEMSGNTSRRTALVVTQSANSVQKVFAHHTPAGYFYRGVYPGQTAVEDLRGFVRQVLLRQLA